MNIARKKLLLVGFLLLGLSVTMFMVSNSTKVLAQGHAKSLASPALGGGISTDLVAGSFSSPTALASTGVNGDDRLFVAEKTGLIRIIEDVDTGNVLATPFLNISSLVSTNSERGLLGLTFSPDYDTSGEFYVYYTTNASGSFGDIQIVRYTVSGNPNVANAGSAELVITVPQQADFHNGGHLAFGPDSYLYIGTGDDGFGGDSQGDTLIGKMLRLNVIGQTTYSIPGDNPYVGNNDIPDEVWSIGLRNPWRFSFDSSNGSLWIADVGDDLREEVNRRPSSSNGGENYGWPCFEGTFNLNGFGCPGPISHTEPVYEYAHGGASGAGSITGGYVYRGSRYCNIQGQYFFGDFNSGTYGMLSPTFAYTDLGSLGVLGSPTTFGEDSADELYIATFGGNVYHLEGTVCLLDEFLYLPIITKP